MLTIVSTVALLTSVYALLAAGVVILYRAGRVLNLAHGELAIVGGYVFYSVGLFAGFGSILLPTLGVIAFSAVTGVVIYAVLMRRIVGEPFYVAILVTIGIAIILKAAIIVVWRAQRVTIDLGLTPLYRFPGGMVTEFDVASVVLTAATFIALFGFFRYARIGIQFRGVAEKPLLASQRGVNVHVILAVAWSIALLTACLAGIVYGGRAFLSTESTVVGLAGITAALVGGLDSLRGAVVGAFIVAAAQYVTIRMVDPIASEAVPFILLLIVMVVRPWGLFGTQEELDRV